MDRIDLFRIFIRVVECSSFTRAADTLGMPRSSVSAAVQELEARIGVRLLHRTTRKVLPTADGTTFYDHGVRLVADMEEVENLFRRSARELVGRLHIDVPGRIGRLVVAPALPDFIERYPGIEIVLGVTDRIVDLIEERVDAVLRVGPLEDSTLIARRLGELQLVNVASPDYLARHGTPAAPADLSGHWAVNYASPSTGRVDAWEWLDKGQLHSMSVRGHVTVNNAEAYIACCLAGLGLIQVPAYDVRRHLERHELVEVMPEHRAAPMPLTLLFPHRRQLPRRLDVFAHWLEDVLRRELVS